MNDSAGMTRRGFVRTAGVVTAGLGLGSVMGATRADAATAQGRRVAGQGLDSSTASRLDAAIRAVMKQASIPGSIVGLWMPGGSYVRTFGVADKVTRAPMRTGFYMRIGSETKTFTVSAILQLVDQGLIGLDDPIAKYVPGVPDGQQITIRELARMQSGLYNYSASPQFTEALYANPYRAWTPGQLLAYSFLRPLNFAPGAGWEYSNTNTVLLGLVVEQVSRQRLQDYLRDHIFRPFGLRQTIFPTGSEFPFPHAHGYSTNEVTGGAGRRDRLESLLGMGSRSDDLHAQRPAPVGAGTGHRPRPSHPADASRAAPDRTSSRGAVRCVLRPRAFRDRRVDRSQRLPAGLPEPHDLPSRRARHPGHPDKHG